MYAMAVTTVETTQMNGIAVCSHGEVNLKEKVPLAERQGYLTERRMALKVSD